jgi:hypothetical protein
LQGFFTKKQSKEGSTVHNSLNAELARQRIANRLAEADHQRLIRQTRRHTSSHPHSRPVPILITLARRIRLARRPAPATS